MAMKSKEYYAEIESVYKKPEDYELAGKGNAYVRIDAEAKVTGKAVYTDDVDLPGMYYCKLVHSPYVHANIVSIDFSEALKVPGVKGVLTGQDFPEGHNLGNPEAFKELADKEPLCRKKVRMVGDEVAAVCAISEEIATEAAALVKVEYEPLPPVLDPFESMAPDAPAIHYPDSSNLSIFTVMKAGDTEKPSRKPIIRIGITIRPRKWFTRRLNPMERWRNMKTANGPSGQRPRAPMSADTGSPGAWACRKVRCGSSNRWSAAVLAENWMYSPMNSVRANSRR